MFAGGDTQNWTNPPSFVTGTPDQRGVRILTLDGGGVRGLVTLTILAQIEKVTGCQIKDMFDMIVGTSAGGLVAAALSCRCGTQQHEL